MAARCSRSNCASDPHGSDGRGDRKVSDVGFPYTMPNFHDCSFANREADGDWSSIIHRGGPRRAFPRTMPAFDQALSDDEIDAIIGYLRSFCEKSGWPRGEFNFPLAMFTEKAFPEDEALNLTTFNTTGARDITSTSIYERRFGARGQLEVNLPSPASIAAPAPRRASAISAWRGNETCWPMWIAARSSACLAKSCSRQAMPRGAWETAPSVLRPMPCSPNPCRESFSCKATSSANSPPARDFQMEAHAHLSLGRTFAGDKGWGRSWSPQVELLTWHEFSPGAQVIGISRHSCRSVFPAPAYSGQRGPARSLNNAAERKPMFVFYVIWDWYDAGLFEGWH